MTIMDLDSKSSDTVLERLALDWLDGDHQARLIVDHALTILWSNRAAETQLARRSDIERRGSLLAPTHASHPIRLEQLIEDCAGGLHNLCHTVSNGERTHPFIAQKTAP